MPLIVSVMGTSHEEFALLVEAIGSRDEVAALELNVSCPNVHSGLVVGESPDEARSLLEALRPLTPKPLIVKLTPNVHPAPVAEAAVEGGADAVSLINTLRAVAIDPDRQAAVARGGARRALGGGGARDRAEPGARGRRAVDVPIVAMGGVATGRHAADLIAEGASLVAVGTESFRDPAAGSRVAAELAATDVPRRPLRAGVFPRRPQEWGRRSRRARIYCRPMKAPVQTSNAAPERSLDQRMEALNKANNIRSKRAKLKRDLKAGKANIQTLLLDPPKYVETAKVLDMLLAVPKYGRVKTNRILNQCRISPSKTIGGLSERQRSELVTQLRR